MSDPDVKWSPKFAREQRRKSLFTGLFGIVMGAVISIDALHAMRTGSWVQFGSVSNAISIPGWLEALLGLAIVLGSVTILWRNVIRRS